MMVTCSPNWCYFVHIPLLMLLYPMKPNTWWNKWAEGLTMPFTDMTEIGQWNWASWRRHLSGEECVEQVNMTKWLWLNYICITLELCYLRNLCQGFKQLETQTKYDLRLSSNFFVTVHMFMVMWQGLILCEILIKLSRYNIHTTYHSLHPTDSSM